MTLDTFATRLRTMRTEASLSVTDLAEKSGLARTYLHDLEAGRRQPSLATATRLVVALDRSLAVFDNLS